MTARGILEPVCMRNIIPAALVAALIAPAPAAFAQASDAARAPVQSLCDGLIGIMKGGKAMGPRGRAAAIGPVVDRVYDVPLAIAYRLRSSGGSWKIVDVFYRNSISQLATRRSDFSRVLATGGAKALIKHLDALAAKGDN